VGPHRDALEAPAVWILYPGDDFRVFDAHQSGSSITDPNTLRLPIEGVGAIPLAPDESDLDHLKRVLEHLLDR
jgi:hypothetical protein